MTEINIGGQNRPVRYDFNAVIEFEDLTGIDPTKAGADFGKLKNFRAFAYCVLKSGAKYYGKELDFDLEKVGSWLDVTDGTTMMAFSKLFSVKESKEEAEAGETKN